MGSSENLGTNSASSTNGGILPLSLLDSASLSAALDDNSALSSLQIKLRPPNGSDPISSELSRQEKLTGTTDDLEKFKSSVDFSNKRTNPVNYLNNYSPLFKNQQNSSLITSQQSEITKSDNKTGFDRLTGATTNTPLINVGTSDPVVGSVNNSLSIPSLLPDILPPTLSATVLPLNLLPGSPQARVVGIVNGTGSAIASLTVAFDNLAAGPISVSPLGAFDHALDFTGLNDGPHTFTLKATDFAGNFSTASFSVTVNLAATPPAILAALAHDTAPDNTTNTDGITFDPTTTGTVKVVNRGIFINALTTVTPIVNAVANVSLTETNQIISLKAGFDNTQVANYLNVIADLHSDGSFTLSPNRLNTIYGGILPDGHHTLHLQAVDKYSVANNFDISFTLDTTTAVPTLKLSANSDSGLSNSDRITLDTTPTIIGTAEALARVQLFNNGQLKGQTTATADGTWQITTSELTDGVYGLNAIATDTAGNTKTSAAIDVTIDSALPQVSLTTPVNQSNLHLGDKLTGSVDGTGSPVTALSYRFDNLQNVSLNFNANGRFDQVLDFTGLSNGEHTLTIAATDTAGNIKTIQYTVTVIIDLDAPVITASLKRDTAPNGQTNSDTITFDPTITGTVIDASRVVEFKAGFDSTQPANFVNVLAQRIADGSFTLTRAQLEQIYGGTLPDGFHTLHLQAVDEFQNTSNIFDFSFTLDSTTSEPIFNLNAVSDSGVIGDFQTKFDTVTLTGLAEANSTVVLEQTGAVTTSDNNGQFTFAHVSLATGDNSFTARSTDIAGNQNTFLSNIYRFSPPTAINLTGNTVAENSSTGTVIGQLSSVDPDPDDTYTYILQDNAGERFRIVGNQLQVADGTLLNFESSTQHSVTVTSTDANGLSLTQVFAIAVTNVNEAPTFLTTPVITANLASLYTYNIVAADPDAGDNLKITTENLPSWLTLVDNFDGTATLSGTPRDFLSNLNSNIHLLVTDAAGLTAVQDFIIAPSIYDIEENNFTVFRSLPLLIPSTPSILSFKIDPQFDITSVNSINDAFEVALVDTNGNSLVHTAAGERDAFFNWTEGESTALGAGTSYDAATHTVSLNLTGINPGTNAQLVFRLVNNDGDITTNVRITDFAFTNALDGTQAPIQTDFPQQISQTTAPNFNLLVDVSSSIGTEYHRTSFNADTHLLYADIALRNIGSYSVDSSLIVAVNHISDPTVLVRNPDGFTPDGLPYYDFSKLVGDTKFDPNELTFERSLIFYNPQGVQFTYDLTVLSQLNAAPVILTQANKEVIAGHSYSYDVDATDPNGDSLTYKLLVAPDGMTIDQTTGLIYWNTATTNIGNQTVLVEVGDGHGGITQQQYSLSVIDAPPNRPPVFTSTPVVDAAINTSYTYQANASDADDDSLTYSFVNAPAGMTIDGSTGKISWVPTTISFQSLPFVSVTIRVVDQRGGVADQSFKINVQPEPGNHAPIIISEPVTQVYSPSSTLDGVVFGLKSQAPGSNASSQAPTKLFSFNVDGSNFKDLGVVTLNNSQIDADGLAVSEKYGLLGFALSSTGSTLISINSNTSVAKALGIPLANREIRGAVFDLDDNLWVIDVAKSELLNLNPLDGSILKSIALKFSGQPLSLLDGADIAVDAQGQFYLTTYSSLGSGSGIYTLNITTGALTQLISDPGQYLAGITFASADNTSNLFGYEVNLTDDIFSYKPNTNFARTTLFSNIISEFNAGRGDLAAIVQKPKYSYSVQAIDPDNDSLNYSLVTAPIGMKIDSNTGSISWDNPVANTTPYDVTLQVQDNRGGIDIQSFQLNVSSTKPGQLMGIVHQDDGRLKDKLVYYEDFENSTKTLSEWSQPKRETSVDNRHILGLYQGSPTNDPETFFNRPDRKQVLTLKNLPEHDIITLSFDLYIVGFWNGSFLSSSSGITNPNDGYGPDLWSLTFSSNTQTQEKLLLQTAFGAVTGVDNRRQAYPYSFVDSSSPLNAPGTGASEIKRLFPQYNQYSDSVYKLSFTFDHSASSMLLNFIGDVKSETGNESWGLDNVEIWTGKKPTPLQGVPIYLDTNNNSQRDAYEPFTLSDTNGAYSFTLNPGTYTVAEEIQSGWTQTIPTSKTHKVTLKSDQVITGLNFGNQIGTNDNLSPVFVSTALTEAISGQIFRYSSVAKDPNQDTLIYNLLVNPDGMIIDSKTGILVWQPTTSQQGMHDVILQVQDNQGGQDIQAFKINVAPPNTLPTFTTSPSSTTTAVGQIFQYQVHAEDPENEAITYSLTSTPPGATATIDSSTGVFKYTPKPSDLNGNSTNLFFAITATDTRGGKTTQYLNISVVGAASSPSNNLPIISSTPRKSIVLGQSYVYIVTASDPNYDPLTISLETAPQGMTIDQQGRITWQPGATQIGSNPVNIKVSDGRGGVITQAFNIDVVSSTIRTNNAPNITSTPNLITNLERTYVYNLSGSDLDNDLLVWSLDSSPASMVIDPQSGALRWQPKADQIGEHTVTVRLTDAYGLYAAQEFTLHVTGVNTPSAIVSNPITRAAQNQLYTYTVVATDPENDPLTFSLGRKPAGMTIDSNGTIRWTPQASQIGSQQVEVFARDAQGAITTQTYAIEVGATAINTAPSITSTPVYLAAVGSPYSYQVQATDPDAGDRLTYQLLSVPAGVTGINIDPSTGLLTWNNPVAGNYKIVVGAVDAAGLGAAQGFTLTARENHAPVIQSNPKLTATPGSTYAYDIIASDVDGDRLSYNLDQASRDLGMTLDALGRLRWTPTANNVGTHHVVLTVSDGVVSRPQEYNLVVAADTEAPKVRLIANYDVVDPGETIIFQARATDNIRVAGLRLWINDTPVVLDGNGIARFTPSEAGTVIARAIATDTAGNPSQEVTFNVLVRDPDDVAAPEVSLDWGDNAGKLITAPIEIKGSISDDGEIDYYRLLVAPINGGEFKEIAFVNDPGAIANGVLGKFDPSLLQNDSYILRLEVADNGGHISYADEVIDVAGDLKLGNFRLSFTDLTVPVTGIPITLTRTYDSLNSGSTDDFGYGWRMEFRDTDLRTSLRPPSEDSQLVGYQNPFKNGTKVYITLPGGKREAFTFKAKQVEQVDGGSLLYFSKYFYQPEFVADKGVTSTLTVESNFITKQQDADEFYGFQGNPYNPADPLFGGKYKLTTKEGVVYEIDAATGDLLTVTDTNGNMLTYTDADITSSTGQKITFGRDAQGRIATVTDPAGKQIRYDYNAQGDLVSVTDREGNTTRMEYDQDRKHYLDKIIDPLGRTGVKNEYGDDGRLKEIIDVNGKAVEMSYDPNNSRQVVKDTRGYSTTYIYDERGNVLQEIDAKGGITTRTYDNDNNLLSETDADGVTTEYTYDNRRNLLTIEDEDGNITRMTYNSRGQANNIVSPTGLTTSAKYDLRGNLIESIDTDGLKTTYTYNQQGQLRFQTAPDGQVTEFDYDSSGHINRMVDSRGNEVKADYDLNGRIDKAKTTFILNGQTYSQWMDYDYDDNGRTIASRTSQGNSQSMSYDALGRVSSMTDVFGNVTSYRYDLQGTSGQNNTLTTPGSVVTRIDEMTLPDNTPLDNSDNPKVIKKYDQANNLVAQISPTGLETRYIYDELGRLAKTILPDLTPDNWDDNPTVKTEYSAASRVKAQTDVYGNREEYFYNDLGQLIRLKDILTNDTTYTYNKGGQIETVTDPRLRTTRYVYDDKARLKETVFFDNSHYQVSYDELGRVKTETNELNQTTTYEYDAFSQVSAVINALNQRTEFEYDQRKNLVKVTDALGHSTRYKYDEYAQQVETLFNNGDKVSIGYDQFSRVTSVTDENLNTTKYTYDNLSQLTQVEQANQAKTKYTYNNLGLLTQTQDANQNITQYEYDDFYRLTATILPMGQRNQTVYDKFGQVSSQKDFNGDTINYSYDSIGRLQQKTFTDPRVATVSYTYDSITSQLKTVTDGRGVTQYNYDQRDRLSKIIQPDQQFVSYGYDLLDNVTSLTTQAGITSYGYDKLNRLDTVKDGNRTLADYDYDAVGNLIQTKLANGSVESRQYDTRDRLTQVTTKNVTGTIFSDFKYTLDAVGNRKKVEEYSGRSVDYTYDSLYRLTEEKITDATAVNRTFGYSYDLAGNRLSKTDSLEGSTTYTYDANNRLKDTTIGSVVTNFTYDNNGSLKQRANSSQTINYNWINDGENRLIGVISSSATGISQQQYIYDAFGSRVATISDGARTNYLAAPIWDLPQVLMEYDSAGEITTDYTLGMGLVQSRHDGREGFYHTDGLGSTRLITDNVGLITDRYTYDAFGGLLDQTGTFGNSFGFAGEQRDAATGLDYLRARYYDSSLGRFISKDEFPGYLNDPYSQHDYQYAHANPVRYTDPSGYFTLGDAMAAVTLAGQLATFSGIGFGVGYIAGAAANGASGEEILGMFGEWGAGFASGVSGGFLTDVYEYTTGQKIEPKHAMLYNAGNIAGIGVSFITGMKAATWAKTAVGPLKWVSRIDDALDAYDAAKSTYNLYQSYQDNGKFEREDVWNLLAYVPFAGAILGTKKFFAANKAINAGADDVIGDITKGPDNVLRMTQDTGTKIGNCFVAGTEILTTEGIKNIEDIKVGDWVIADDPTTPGEIEARQVTDTFVRKTTALVDLYVDGEVISTTGEHPFWTPDKGWVEAKDLQVGSLLQTEDGRIIDVDRIEKREGQFEVYNFSVEEFHTYYVSELGILVHNARKDIYFGDGVKADSDVFHKDIKPNILSKAGKFQGKVGKNPDIKVVNGKIVLTGTGQFKGKSFKTDILASDFFGKSDIPDVSDAPDLLDE
ncbi:MAG: putative Ig domain-containing protein [Nostoc sp. DedQUE08]|uniref:putative Ig domain-containing protein n=1 Tax=Nostoc sp. DedQUE08 TaxID=3075393 RepID=UPI002AD488C9|nr:putative Ig domain-containing protein [Nostoc sp. DedQUE08]MDZ8070038.1 putative Ig domain-containing protein [Nostoc sp. DedQUE08]